MDPNGWIQNPPSTIVQIHGTTRETLNGQYALVLEYRAPRYNVVCAQNPTSVVALKPENLRAVTNFVEKMKAQFEMMKHNPQFQAQFQQVRNRIRSATGMEVQYVAAILVLSLILSIWFLGFTKALFILSTLVMVGTVIGPDLGQPWRTVLANAPMRWKQVIRTQIPKMGPTIADNRIYFNLFTVAVVAFILYSLLVTPGGGSSKSRGSTSLTRSLDNLPDEMILTRQKREEFYKLGFDDATNQREYGFSLPKIVDTPIPPSLEEDLFTADGMDFDGDVHRSKKKNPFSMATALAVFTLYRTLVPLAQRTDDGRFDLQLLWANLSTLEVWKLGLIGFSVYRIVSAFM
jgi:hypothetical protein